MRVKKPKKPIISANGPIYSIPAVQDRPLTAFSQFHNNQPFLKPTNKPRSTSLSMKNATVPPEINPLPISQIEPTNPPEAKSDSPAEKPKARTRRQTLVPQIRSKLQIRPNSITLGTPKDDSFKAKSNLNFPFVNNDFSNSLNRLAQMNQKLQQNQSMKSAKNESTPLFSRQSLASRSTTTRPEFQFIPRLSEANKNQNVSVIKITILSNWGHQDTVACSEIDMLGKNHFPLPVDRIYIEPVNHVCTKPNRLINGNMVKHTLDETWTAKWPPTPPLQSISIIIKANVFDNVVDSMRFWPTNISPTMNIKAVEIYVDDDPVFKGDLPQDFGQVIPLTQMSSDSSEYEYDEDNENHKEEFKVDSGISHNEQPEKNRKKKRVKKEVPKGADEIPKTLEEEKEMKKRNMKKILKQIRFTRNLTIRQAKPDQYGIIPCAAIQNIEIKCFQSFESPTYFSYQWIRMFDSVGEPINVRKNATVTQVNCGKDAGPPGILFFEDGSNERTHYGMWRGEFPRDDNKPPEASITPSKNTPANSGSILVHFTEMTMVTAIVLYTFRHPRTIASADLSAKNVQILVENRLIWYGRLRHRPFAEDDEAGSPNDCATTVFLTAEKEVQESVLKNCFPAMYK